MIAHTHAGRMMLVILVLTISGCINISTLLQPEDKSVKEVLEGSDCTLIILGMGFGTNTVENAMTDALPYGDSTSLDPVNITKIRRIALRESVALFVGSRCIEVVGE